MDERHNHPQANLYYMLVLDHLTIYLNFWDYQDKI